ncbi:MAG: hypothetical protein COB59_07650 [Rhodospirillaceae bacterium]|nr:MAG: hypothetical protein COB59_07650 [Rhodospirillaceae bacterium]
MIKILCIEDEADIRLMLAEELEDEGYKVFVAENGREGLTSIQIVQPDIILCDINMPVMGGYDVLKELRTNHPKFADTPFIFLSAFADRKDIISGLELGADDYLTKPIDFEMLLVKVGTAVRQVTLMKNKKQKEHVKLYNALTGVGDEPEETEEAKPEKIVDDLTVGLIGRDDSEHSGVQAMLETLGYDVTRIISGQEGIDLIAKSEFGLALIGFYTGDMQANMVAKLALRGSGKSMPLIMIWPEEMPISPNEVVIQDFDGVLTMPCSQTDLNALILSKCGP